MKQLQKANVDELKAHFRGDLLLPGDAGYDEVRQIWNAMIDRRPALIARCASPEDVVQAVKFARTLAAVSDMVCVTGSLYTVGEARGSLGLRPE